MTTMLVKTAQQGTALAEVDTVQFTNAGQEPVAKETVGKS